MAEQPATTAATMPPTTLASLMQNDLVSMATLLERHGSAATIAQVLLGIVPNTGKYLEVWPPANRTYYVIVPNFLNMPSFMVGFGAPKALVSLALYVSSLGADCPYCTSHTCTFAMRRGVSVAKLTPEALAARTDPDQKLFSTVELSVIDVAEHLGHMPSTLTPEMRRALRERVKSAGDVEWILLAVAMMGFLNKSMDALGLPLEIPTYQETRSVLGTQWSPRSNGQVIDPEVHIPTPPPPTDGLWTYLSLLPQAPGAASYERRVLASIPDTAAAARAFLEELTGYDFALLSELQHGRGIRAVTSSLYENLNPAFSVVGMATKAAVGMVFATTAQSAQLRALVRTVAAHNGVDSALLDCAAQFASTGAVADLQAAGAASDATMLALLRVARAASSSPAKITEGEVSACREAGVSSAAMVEVISFVSALQLLYRLTVFYVPEE